MDLIKRNICSVQNFLTGNTAHQSHCNPKTRQFGTPPRYARNLKESSVA